MKTRITYAHMHQRGFVPGINKQIEKGLGQETCPGIEMYRLENGDLECFFQGRHFFLHGVNFQSMVAETEEEQKKREKTEIELKKKDQKPKSTKEANA